MTIQEAIRARHSVRQYLDKPLDPAAVSALTEELQRCNQESGLHIQLVQNEPTAFQSRLARYGSFRGVNHYFALVGQKSPELEERCGYYGQRLVLLAQQLGLNTCWVALTYRKVKTAFTVGPGEKLCAVIALGYGCTQGEPHKSRPAKDVMRVDGSPPAWFLAGVEAALLAPTAVNQQKFIFSLQGDRVSAKAGTGFYAKIDLGIVKYHFEAGAGKENFQWA